MKHIFQVDDFDDLIDEKGETVILSISTNRIIHTIIPRFDCEIYDIEVSDEEFEGYEGKIELRANNYNMIIEGYSSGGYTDALCRDEFTNYFKATAKALYIKLIRKDGQDKQSSERDISLQD